MGVGEEAAGKGRNEEGQFQLLHLLSHTDST